ncbi:MAG: c-type cytochrome, partial [Vicinamibacterales bacterium]
MNCTNKLRLALGVVAVTTAVLMLLERAPRIDAQTLGSPTYTAEQATQGQAAYAQSCASCHGANLDDGPFAGPVKGSVFRQQWGSKTVEELFTYVSTRMPPTSPGSLGDERYAQVLAYLLQQNGVGTGTRPLPVNPEQLRTMVLPASPPGPGGGLTAGVPLPPAPARTNPLDTFTPVTDAVLNNPSERDWLTWRRTQDAQGFS